MQTNKIEEIFTKIFIDALTKINQEADKSQRVTVYLPPIESYLDQAEQEAWSFIQNNSNQSLSIERIHAYLASCDTVENLDIWKTQTILKNLEGAGLINLEHALSTLPTAH